MIRWIYEVDKERQCFKVLTEDRLVKSGSGDDSEPDERQWIADVFEEVDAMDICDLHNIREEEFRIILEEPKKG